MITLYTAIEKTDGGVRVELRAGFNMGELKPCGELNMPLDVWLDYRRVVRASYYSRAKCRYAADDKSRIPTTVEVDREEMFVIIDDRTTNQVMTSMIRGDE